MDQSTPVREPRYVVQIEGVSFLPSGENANHECGDLPGLNTRLKLPAGVFEILACSSSSESDDDNSQEKKVFVAVELCVSQSMAMQLQNDTASVDALLDEIALDLSPDLSVDRSDWECVSSESLLAALQRDRDMSLPITRIRDVVERFGIERLRGLPIKDGPHRLFISDSCIDSNIELWEDEPESAMRTSRFSGSEVYNDPLHSAWIYRNTPIEIASRMLMAPVDMEPGDIFFTSTLGEPGRASQVFQVSRVEGQTIHAWSERDKCAMEFSRADGLAEGGELIVMTGGDLIRFRESTSTEAVSWAQKQLYPHVPMRLTAAERMGERLERQAG